jgi:two-component system response regulator (stage 0 sporulation protein A)
MNEMISVVLAIKDKNESENVSTVLEATGKICIKAKVTDGNELINSVLRFNPDVIVSEIMLPNKDGLSAYSEIISKGLSPSFVALSQLFTDNEITDANRLKVSYLVLKPYNMNDLAEKVINHSQAYSKDLDSKKNLEVQVTETLHDLGLPSHIKGFQYVRAAIMMTVEDMNKIHAITKVLYPSIAKMFDTTTSRVERAIRHSIEVAWARADLSVLTKEFGYTISEEKGKPTNSEFISMIADKIRLKRMFM